MSLYVTPPSFDTINLKTGSGLNISETDPFFISIELLPAHFNQIDWPRRGLEEHLYFYLTLSVRVIFNTPAACDATQNEMK